MIIIIPGQLISLVTFPGVVLHEISHRFFCDIYNIPVYEICYFKLLSLRAGHVIHGGAQDLESGLLISFGPLIINSLVCMLLLIPYGYATYLQTSFIIPNTIGQALLLWLGYSIGLNAIPSDQDVKGLGKLAKSELSQEIIFLLQGIISIFNLPFIGFWLQIGYVYILAQLLPALLLR